MLRLCYKAIKECTDSTGQTSLGDPDFPLLNLSSEKPEVPEYVIYTPGGTHQSGTDDPTKTYAVEGCLSTCTSEVSLEEALLCAAKQALICYNDKPNPKPPVYPGTDDPIDGGQGSDPNPDPGGGTDDPDDPGNGGDDDPGDEDPGDDDDKDDDDGPTYYESEAVSCVEYCADGTSFIKSIPAGKFVGMTQALANKQAELYACQRARLELICLPQLPTRYEKICLYEQIDFKMTVGGINPPYEITVDGLPGGVDGQVNETGTAITFTGKPTSQSEGFTLTVRDKFGNVVIKSYSWEISGVSPSPQELPVAYNLCPYSFTFEAIGVVEGTTEWICIGIPDGLHMSGGTLSGDPTTPGSYNLRVCWWDSAGHSCCADYTLTVYDCASIPKGSFQTSLGEASQTFRLSSNLMPCERVVHVQALGFRAGLIGPAYAFLFVKIYSWDGTQTADWSCGWISPYPAEMDQYATFPATPCNQTGARRIEVEYIYGCFSPTADDCGMACTLSIDGF